MVLEGFGRTPCLLVHHLHLAHITYLKNLEALYVPLQSHMQNLVECKFLSLYVILPFPPHLQCTSETE
jgi:hypothetical protein